MDNLKDQIKRALAGDDKTLGVLKDETGADYEAIFGAVDELVSAGEIEQGWTDGDACPALCYRLKKRILLPSFLTRY